MLIVYAISCILFLAVFERLKLVASTRALFAGMRQAMGVMTNRELSDDEKEIAIQRHAVSALKGAVMLTVGLAATLFAAAIPPVAADWMGWIDLDAFVDFSLDPWVLLATVVIIGAAVWAYRRFKPAEG